MKVLIVGGGPALMPCLSTIRIIQMEECSKRLDVVKQETIKGIYENWLENQGKEEAMKLANWIDPGANE